MESKKHSEVLLTYKTSTIRKRELDNLQDGCWLNDQVINFYYEYLSHKFLFSRDDVLLLDPSSVAMFHFSQNLEDTVEIFGPLHLERKQTVLMPVNDNSNKYAAGGGSHWALLVYSSLVEGEEGGAGNQFTYIDLSLIHI